MQIVSLGDGFHEMLKPIFGRKIRKTSSVNQLLNSSKELKSGMILRSDLNFMKGSG